tara:strand:- start:435 stop:662 length:228 start_codon:yes stop_codon:yes gene_type:complete
MNCINCGCRLTGLKCDYCGTLNKSKTTVDTELGKMSEMRKKLEKQLQQTMKMKIPESLKKKKLEIIEKSIASLEE